MIDLTFAEYDGPNRTDAIPLITSGYRDLLDAGLAPHVIPFHYEMQAIVASYGGCPVGVIVYTYEKWQRLVWVHLTYVIPPMRRCRVYTQLWQRVVAASRKLGAVEIHGSTHCDNAAMLAAAAAVGRHPAYTTIRYVIPEIPA